MPVFKDDMVEQNLPGTTYGFSAVRLEKVGSTTQSLATVVVDVSGSTHPFRSDMEKAIQSVVESCRTSPHADSMMLRVVLFDSTVTEFHGFKPLTDCNETDYVGCLGQRGGVTALYDATYNALQSATQYGGDLTKKEYDVNAITFVITDGGDNDSTVTRKMVKDALNECVTSESLESMNAVLVGVNTQNAGLNSYLQNFKDECGFTQYVALEDSDPNSLAKLADFISKSISSTSQALGSGGVSQSLAF